MATRTLTALCLASALALAPGVIRAASLEDALAEGGAKAAAHVRSRGYKTAGVLRFAARRAGDKEPRFDLGPVHASLAERFENLLVLQAADRDGMPNFGVLHDPGTVALRMGGGKWFATPAGRKALFGHPYPLAWGDARKKADVFFTGTVELARDPRSVTLTILAFDAASPGKMTEVARLKAAGNAQLVRDCGLPVWTSPDQRAALARVRGGAKRRDLEEEIVLGAAEDTQDRKPDSPAAPDQKPGTPAGPATPASVGGVRVSILDGSTNLTPEAGASSNGQYEMPCPPRESNLSIVLENTTDQRLAVVLKVGGRSTIDQQTKPDVECFKYIVAPGKKATVRGCLVGEKLAQRLPFAVRPKDELKQSNPELGDAFDLIEVVVFESGPKPAGDEEVVITRGGPPRLRAYRASAARKDYRTLERAILAEGGLVRSGDTITWDAGKAVPAGPVKREDFLNPTEVQRLSIRLTAGGGGGGAGDDEGKGRKDNVDN